MQAQFPAKLGDGDASTMIGDGSLEKPMKTRVGLAPEMVIGEAGKVTGCDERAVAGGSKRNQVCKILTPAINTPTKLTSTLSKPELERLKGRVESEGDGQQSLSVRLELLAIKRTLTNLRREVDAGVGIIESVLGYLESNGPILGPSVGQTLGFSVIQELGPKGKEKACSGVFPQPNGPKPNNNKKKKKKKKPGRGLQAVGLRGRLEMRKFQVGETSSAGALSSAASSILGKFEWVSKVVGYVDVGSASAVACELERGLGSGEQEPGEVGLAAQRTPTVISGSVGCPSKAGVKPAIPCPTLKVAVVRWVGRREKFCLGLCFRLC